MDGETLTGLRPHRFTVADYHAMNDAGVFNEDSRVELIHGQVIDMSAIGAPHFRMVTRLNMMLTALVRGQADVSVQNPVRLDDYSEPQPDVALIRPNVDADETTPYFPSDVLLLIEVADSSLVADRRVKIPLYAQSGIAEYWIVNLADRCIEVHRQPEGERYADVTTISTGTLAITTLPGLIMSADAIFQSRP